MGQPEQSEAACRLSQPALSAGDMIDLLYFLLNAPTASIVDVFTMRDTNNFKIIFL